MRLQDLSAGQLHDHIVSLLSARDDISDSSRWLRGQEARSSRNTHCKAEYIDAFKFDTLGALKATARTKDSYEMLLRLLSDILIRLHPWLTDMYLASGISFRSGTVRLRELLLQEWNDITTHEDVVSLYDEAVRYLVELAHEG